MRPSTPLHYAQDERGPEGQGEGIRLPSLVYSDVPFIETGKTGAPFARPRPPDCRPVLERSGSPSARGRQSEARPGQQKIGALGAGGGTRTPTGLPLLDFESSASTNSTTPARERRPQGPVSLVGRERSPWTNRGQGCRGPEPCSSTSPSSGIAASTSRTGTSLRIA